MAKDTHVSELLAEVFRRGGMKRSLKRAQAVLLWPQVAGKQLAAFTRARSLVDGVLIVEVPDSETAMHLTLQRQRFLDVFQGKFGAREVRDIRFQTGRRVGAEEQPAVEAKQVQVDPTDLAQLTRALGELELPDELSQPALQAAQSMLAYRARRKAEGWSNCPTCDALTPETGLCSTCRRYSEDPQVVAAAGRLAVNPSVGTPALSEEQRSVASLLAQRELAGTLSELLPQVLADPQLRQQLETVARCYLALRLGKAPAQVSDADLALLPPKVARILGHLDG
ncbi:MAG TPA: DUF721 domain-containing protein [Trueperaceae bacterium]